MKNGKLRRGAKVCIIAFLAIIACTMGGCASGLYVPDPVKMPSTSEEQSIIILPDSVTITAVDGKSNMMGNRTGTDPFKFRAFSIPSGEHELTLSYRGVVNGSGKMEYNFISGKTYGVVGEAKASNGSYATTSQGVRLYILEATDNSLFRIPNPEKTENVDVTFSSDGSKIVFCVGKTIYVHSSTDGTLLTTLTGHKGNVTSVKFNANGDQLFSTSEDKTVRAWEISGNNTSTTLITSKNKFSRVEWSADSSILALIVGKQVEVYDIGAGKLLTTFTGHNQNLRRLAISPDGNRIVSVGTPGNIFSSAEAILWESRTGKQLVKGQLKYIISGIAWQPEGNRIAVAYQFNQTFPEGQIVLLDETLQEENTIQAFPEFVNFSGSQRSSYLYFKPDGTELLCITMAGTVAWRTNSILLDTVTGDVKEAITHYPFLSYHAAYSPDGSKIAMLTSDGVRVWNSDFNKD